MDWPYHFVNLSPEQISERRKLLDLYGFYAWLSPIALVCSIYLSRILLPTISRRSVSVSPSQHPTFFRVYTRRLLWVLHSPLSSDFGHVKAHLIGLLYTSWLLFLTLHNTGNDYMHYTKRLGHIAVSQLPLQYLLSAKSPLSPIQLATGLSHETLNPYHRLTGRIIHLFLLAHAVLYLNFFYAINALPRRLYDRDVQLGLLAIILLTALAISASASNRRKSYHSSFYVPHALLSFLLIPVISAHVPYTRRYVLQILILYLFNTATRRFSTTTPPAPATITPVKGTNGALLHISIPTPKPLLGAPIPTHFPGQHIYLKAGHNPKFPRSPFTIASGPPPGQQSTPYHDDPLPDLELVVRNLGGPTTAWLAGLDIKTTTTNKKLESDQDGSAISHADGSLLSSSGSASQPSRSTTNPSPRARKLDVLVEGPYGASSCVVPPLLASFSNLPAQENREDEEEVLLIAGGVGATFTLPIYVSLLRAACTAALKGAGIGQAEAQRQQQQQQKCQGRDVALAVITSLNSISQRIHFRWVVRSRAEAEWGVEYLGRAIRGLEEEIEIAVGREGSVGAGRSHHRTPQQVPEPEPEPEPKLDELPGGRSGNNELKMNVKIYITRATQPDRRYEENDSEKLSLNSKDLKEEDTKTCPPTRVEGTSSITTPHPSSPLPPAGVEIITSTSTSTPNTSTTITSIPTISISNRPPLPTLLINSILSPSNPHEHEHSPPFPAKKKKQQQQQQKSKHNCITILTCAPPRLSTALREQVGRHVMRDGRDVRWFEEGFGMGA